MGSEMCIRDSFPSVLIIPPFFLGYKLETRLSKDVCNLSLRVFPSYSFTVNQQALEIKDSNSDFSNIGKAWPGSKTKGIFFHENFQKF